MLMLSLLSPAAVAAPIEAWSRTEFPAGVVAGNDGWTNGYSNDGWWGQQGTLFGSTDDNDNANSYGNNNPRDNWLVRGDDIGDGQITVNLRNEDDDTIGVVMNRSSATSWYLIGHSYDSWPEGGFNGVGTWFVVRIEGGQASILATGPGEIDGQVHELTVTHNAGDIRVSWDGTEILTATDPSPLPKGKMGVYSYDAGYDGQGNNNSNVEFRDVTAYRLDNDSDGAPNDTDNCINTPNTDQKDSNNNGTGDACEDTDPNDTDPPDTDPPDTSEPVDSAEPIDTAEPNDTSPPSPDTAFFVDGFNREPVGVQRGCGCSSAGAGGGTVLWILALLGVGLRRRR